MIETLKAYDEAIERTRSFSQTLKIYPKIFEKPEFQELHKFMDKALLSSLNLMDLIIGIKFLDLSRVMGNTIEANYFARIVILTSHEILNDLNILVGKDVRNEFIDKLGPESILKLDNSIKKMNVLKKEHLKKLKNFRNSVIGHKLSNGLEQAAMMEKIDTLEIYKIGEATFKAQTEITTNYVGLITSLK